MNSNLISEYNELKTKAIEVNTQIKQHYQTTVNLKKSYSDTVDEIKDVQKTAIILDSSVKVLKEILEKISEQYIEKIVNLVTYALNSIFYDKDYSVEIEVSDKRNSKTAELFLIERKENEVIRTSFNDSIGGGIVAVVGFVLQVYYIGYLNQSKIMFVDEGFSQISSRYIDSLIEFIRELSRSKGFIFVLVSHDERLIPFANKLYEVSEGKVKEIEKRERQL